MADTQIAETQTAVANINADALIDRISDGAFLRDLAKETGIDKRRLSEHLRKHPAYASAKETSIEVQLDDAQLALTLAREPADIARAREMFRAAAWRAEREFPNRWGARHEIHHTFSISDELQAIAERRQLEAAQHDVSDAHIISESGRK